MGFSHPHASTNDISFVPAPLPTAPIITGSGKFRYQYDPTKFVLPSSVNLENAHGLAVSPFDSSIYFTYQSTDVADDTRALIRFNPDGTNATFCGEDNFLAYGVPHGLKLSVENGVEYLYHANNEAIVHKTTTDGKIIWTRNMTSEWEGTDNWPFKPTDVVVPPGSTTAYVADGYGSSKVHGFDITTGNYTGLVFGGHGNATDPIKFNCDHGLSWDFRTNQLLVSDRANNQLRWIDVHGHQFHSHVYPQSPLPCNAQTSHKTSLGEDYLIVPDLGESVSGIVSIMDINNTIISILDIAKYLGDSGSKHPHDAVFLANGDIAVVCWAPGTITYWTHLPNDEYLVSEEL